MLHFYRHFYGFVITPDNLHKYLHPDAELDMKGLEKEAYRHTICEECLSMTFPQDWNVPSCITYTVVDAAGTPSGETEEFIIGFATGETEAPKFGGYTEVRPISQWGFSEQELQRGKEALKELMTRFNLPPETECKLFIKTSTS